MAKKKTKIFFATDVHGSEVVFKKFLNAGKVYKVDVLILGGDLTGKMIVPLVEQPDGSYVGKLYGTTYVAKTEEELKRVEGIIKSSGYYPYRTTPEEVEELRANKEKLNKLFEKVALDTLKYWTELAEERLKGTGITLYMCGGNDDIPEVSDILREAEERTNGLIVNPDERVVYIDDIHEMASISYSNMTPWKCPRDIPEEKLKEIIEEVVSQINDYSNAIFNFHVPPYGTMLDIAPELDEELRPKVELGGGMKMTNVGSVSVREAIEKYQPLLGLHGHIHEAKATQKLGRTLCINPGSEYGEGILRGSYVYIGDKKVIAHMFTSG